MKNAKLDEGAATLRLKIILEEGRQLCDNAKISSSCSKSEQLKTISAGNLVRVLGQSQIAPQGHYELHANSLEIIAEGNLNSGYPFSPKQQHNHIREYLRLRHKTQMALHEFMDKHDFIYINTPILTTNDCEGAGEVFTVQPDSNELLKQMSRPPVRLSQRYFDSKVYLTVSEGDELVTVVGGRTPVNAPNEGDGPIIDPIGHIGPMIGGSGLMPIIDGAIAPGIIIGGIPDAGSNTIKLKQLLRYLSRKALNM
uniref:Aminoacyl-tRNA synthetase class II (D/K/N) domain-containing protein n=1 Tax=Glossina austeni TaxID=7395 RepID=A0A1A9UWU2_GLOAU